MDEFSTVEAVHQVAVVTVKHLVAWSLIVVGLLNTAACGGIVTRNSKADH